MMNKKKNILLLIPTFNAEGGTQKMVYELGKLFSERYNVYECSFNAYNEPHVFKNGNEVLSLNYSPGSLLKKITDYPVMARRLRRLKKHYTIDITVSNLWAADLLNILAGGSDKKISIGHINIKGNKQNKLLFNLRHFAQHIYNRFDKIVAVSEPLKDELKEIFKLKSGKATFINNFIDFPKTHLAVQKKANRLVTIGRLNTVKNQQVLIQMLIRLKKQFTELQLVFIGDGPLKESLVAYANSSGLIVSFDLDKDADIVFMGFLSNPFPVLFSSTLFLFPSKSEGLPLVIAEAMFAGLPIVSSDCPTGPHMILMGQGDFKPDRINAEETPFGYLMPIPDSGNETSLENWEEVIQNLLRDKLKLNHMSEKCKERSLDFSKENIKESWFNLLAAL